MLILHNFNFNMFQIGMDFRGENFCMAKPVSNGICTIALPRTNIKFILAYMLSQLFPKGRLQPNSKGTLSLRKLDQDISTSSKEKKKGHQEREREREILYLEKKRGSRKRQSKYRIRIKNKK